ncbi:hypothetical protein CERSUDRAFT_80849 [Gelatoporia subvermispora B]|uniref:DUF6533 domain-containing protein n=1 Tax=Ceriporiopsis subvermispora (strain B) TaxID=914234 RepID=M2RLY5_CERS8|nr:hypothetical protein CERSUDRAFT_80849 [Gelatoporia subvermispora B]
MSYQYGGNSVTTEAVVASLQSQWISRCCLVAASTLLFYDYLATLPREVDLMWARNLNCATLLFHSNRVMSLLWAAAMLVQGFVIPNNITSCIALNNDLVQTLGLVLFTVFAAFSAVRTYAIGGGGWILSSIVFLLGMAPVATNIYGNIVKVWYAMDDLPLVGITCVTGVDYSEATSNMLTIVTRVSVITSDVIVLFVTWWRTFNMRRRVEDSAIKTPLHTMLLRDGTIYFALSLCTSIINIVGLTTNVFAYAAAFVTPLASVIMSHFFLNLRQVAYGRDLQPTSQRPSFVRSQYSSIEFLDNMGEFLDHDNMEYRDEEWLDADDSEVQHEMRRASSSSAQHGPDEA